MVSILIILGIIVSSILLVSFVLPMPIDIDYCNVEFMDNTFYEIQTKCW